MSTMTEKTYKALFEYGKRVYNDEISINDAAKKAHEENPEVAESSARHYINWYERMHTGDFLTWNTNSDLLKYYVRRIFEEEGVEAGMLATESALKFAKHASRFGLETELKEIATENGANPNTSWWPSKEEYNPGFNKEDWLNILNDPEIIGPVWGGVLAMFYLKPEGATCKEAGEDYGLSGNQVTARSYQLGQHIYMKYKCPLIEKDNFWPIMFVGQRTGKDGTGNWKYKMRPELYEACTESGILRYLPVNGGEPEMSIKETVEAIKSYIAAQGFTYPEGMIENFYLSLKSKPFVILAGTSGTGKTRLVKLFSEAIGAKYRMVSVRPDWSDSSDLFGHLDLNGKFIPGEILDYIAEAKGDPDKPYILCLDEMNLARVEYYLSDFLSIIETRDLIDGEIVSDTLMNPVKYGDDKTALEKYGEIRFPQNFYMVGTVNMDETTFPFSKKVLDRANTIEFNFVNLNSFADTTEKVEILNVPNSFLKTKYLLLTQCEDQTYAREISDDLQRINEILQKANSHVGYRVRDEVTFYMMNNKETGLIDEKEAFDNEIMQKILPRIQGSSSSVKNMLCELFKEFAGDYEGFNVQDDDTASKMFAKIAKGNIKYPKSAEKIAFMVRRFEEDGFTSYWL